MGKAKLLVREDFVNRTEGYRYGDNEYESDCETVGELYKQLRREYGRCSGKMYVDTKQGETKQTGWVFEKRAKYDDWRSRGETYLQETWITVHKITVESAFD